MTEPEPPPDPQPQGSGLDQSADAALAAERAGVAYWRDVARQRRIEAARVQHRPLVRAAVALDRRTAGIQNAAAQRGQNLRVGARRAGTTVRGWASRRSLAARRTDLERRLAQLPAADTPTEPETTLVIHFGTAPTSTDPDVTLVAATQPADVHALVEDSTAALVCLLGPQTSPAEEAWLRRLTDFVAGDPRRRAVTPLLLHPERRWADATADDLLVRSAGLETELSEAGDPVPVARAHGRAPDLSGGPDPVMAATGPVLVMGREAFVAAGGLGTHTDLTAAMIDLCLRHRAHGGTVHCVPQSVVTDARPVTDPQELHAPLDPAGLAWRTLVEHHGPALHAAAVGGSTTDRWRIALTTAVPSAKMAPRSGDWHYAGLMAAALGRAGHQVRRQTIDQADSLAGRSCDLHLVLRGLEPVRRTPGQRHVLWVISHPEALEIAECDDADLVLVASERFAAHLRTRTATPVEVLLQATDPDHFRPVAHQAVHEHRVTIVANSRGVARSSVADAVTAGLEPAVYGSGWEGIVDPNPAPSPYAPFDQLPAVYASAGVVLNDHWETMRHWGFVSNRIFDVAACATPVLSDAVPEVTELFGDLVPTWRTPSELRAAVEAIEADPERAATRTAAARELVVAHHTFDHRVQELSAHLETHLGTGRDGDTQ